MLEKMIRAQTAVQERQLQEWMDRRSREFPFPADIHLVENLAYMNDGQPCHRMDLFLPQRTVKEELPILINLHGGGFLLGRKEVNRLFCADLCRRGFLTACLEYPLAPETDLFRILRDLSRGMEAAVSRLTREGGDPNRVFLCGDSAGAWLCVYLAAMQHSAALAGAADVRPAAPEIRAVGLISGMFYTCLPDKIGLFLPSSIYGKGWKKHPFRPYMNPEHSEVAGRLPPAFLVTAEGDFLRHYTRRYAQALQKSGTESVLLDFQTDKSLPHAFAAMLPERPASRQANDEMTAFFQRKAAAE